MGYGDVGRMIVTFAEFIMVMCLHGCVKHGNVVQIPVSPVISNEGPESAPRLWHNGTVYLLVAERSA